MKNSTILVLLLIPAAGFAAQVKLFEVVGKHTISIICDDSKEPLKVCEPMKKWVYMDIPCSINIPGKKPVPTNTTFTCESSSRPSLKDCAHVTGKNLEFQEEYLKSFEGVVDDLPDDNAAKSEVGK